MEYRVEINLFLKFYKNKIKKRQESKNKIFLKKKKNHKKKITRKKKLDL